MNPMNLFHCETIPQYKIGEWLMAQGIARDDIARVELVDHSTVQLTNPAGQYIIVQWADGQAALI